MDKLNTSDSDGRRFHVQNSIAHYRITAKLGQGGMGEVYRATDPKLGRDVAIKLLAPALAHDDVRMASVAREARTLAALSHPNIAAVYGIEESALVMELVDGSTLADRIRKGPLPFEEAVRSRVRSPTDSPPRTRRESSIAT